jgi:hypothetical protein
MESADFKSWLQMINRVGRGALVPPPHFKSDLPIERVRPLSAEQDGIAMEFVTAALIGWLRGRGLSQVTES